MLDLNEKLFFEKTTKNRETCVVLFSKATCHICQQVTPILEELERLYAEQPVSFYHVDAVTEKSLMERLSLKGVPQVLFSGKVNLAVNMPAFGKQKHIKRK